MIGIELLRVEVIARYQLFICDNIRGCPEPRTTYDYLVRWIHCCHIRYLFIEMKCLLSQSSFEVDNKREMPDFFIREGVLAENTCNV
jgi:hypothetical protein